MENLLVDKVDVTHFRATLGAAKIGTWEYDPAARAAKADAQTARLFKLDPSNSGWAPLDQFAAVIHADDVDDVLAQLDRREMFESVFRIADDANGVRWLRAVGSWSGLEGQQRLFGVSMDVTKERERQDELELLIGEMRHRVGNAFAIIAGLVGLEARNADSAEDVSVALRRRLVALSQAHELSFGENAFGEGLSAVELIKCMSTAFVTGGRDVLAFSGRDFPLNDATKATLSLVIYEWFTNALKYGALSIPGGNIDVDLRTDGQNVVLTWRERSDVAAPSGTKTVGFGDHLQAMALKKLNGEIRHEWREGGIWIELSAPQSQFTLEQF